MIPKKSEKIRSQKAAIKRLKKGISMKSSRTTKQQKIVDYRKQLLDGPASACVMIVYLCVFIHVRLCWLVWLCVLLSGHSNEKSFYKMLELLKFYYWKKLQKEKRMWNCEWRREEAKSDKVAEILGRSRVFKWDERTGWILWFTCYLFVKRR